MDDTLTLDPSQSSSTSFPSFRFPFDANQALVGAGAGLVAAGWLALRATTNMFAVASGAAALVGALQAFQDRAGDGTQFLAPADGEVRLDAAASLAASERLAQAWGANLQVSSEVQQAVHQEDPQQGTHFEPPKSDYA